MYNYTEEIKPNTSFEDVKIKIGDIVEWKGMEQYHKGKLLKIVGDKAIIQTEKENINIPEQIIQKVPVFAPEPPDKQEDNQDTVPWEPDNGLIINV